MIFDMKRGLGIFLWILVGAVAAGLGVGLILQRAHADLQQTRDAQAKTASEVKLLRDANDKLARDANKKLADADAEVERAQQLLAALKTERALLMQATPLEGPSASTLARWKTTLSLPLGLSLAAPSWLSVTATADGLIGYENGDVSSTVLSITRFDSTRQAKLTDAMRDPIDRLYRIEDHLLSGMRGTLADTPGTVSVLRDQSIATSTYLFVLSAESASRERTLLDVLGTLRFRP